MYRLRAKQLARPLFTLKNKCRPVRIRPKVCKNQIVMAGRLLTVLDMRPSTTSNEATLLMVGSFNVYTSIRTILDPKLPKQ